MQLFHAHVYFDPHQQAAAAALRQRAAALFSVRVGALLDHPVGPHPKAMFQLLLRRDQLADALPWLMQNRGDLDILVHGATGNDLLDHTQYVMWLGRSLPLKLDIFQRAEPVL